MKFTLLACILLAGVGKGFICRSKDFRYNEAANGACEDDC